MRLYILQWSCLYHNTDRVVLILAVSFALELKHYDEVAF